MTALAAAVLTAVLLLARLVFQTFFGRIRTAQEQVAHHAHESPSSMLVPARACWPSGSVVAGYARFPAPVAGRGRGT